MKLLHCDPEAGGCGDLVRLYAEERACHCGRSVGRYNDDVSAFVRGPCRVLGLDTREVLREERGAWAVSGRVVHTDGGARVLRGEGRAR